MTSEAVSQRAAYSKQETCFKLGGMSIDTLERLISSGALRTFRVNRRVFVSADELSRFIREREEEAQA